MQLYYFYAFASTAIIITLSFPCVQHLEGQQP